MRVKLIHISDLHYKSESFESEGVVLNAFLADLEAQVPTSPDADWWLIFSGDVVQSGSDSVSYNALHALLDERLLKIGIGRARRIVVPGNHDVDTDVVNKSHVDHEGAISLGLDEKRFNDYVSSANSAFLEKFSKYHEFENQFASYGIADEALAGQGHSLGNGIGVYCLNSAWFSSGSNGNDQGRLAVETRKLSKWAVENENQCNILVMHHPSNWLADWAATELRGLLKKHFSICLTGHVHSQDLVRRVDEESPLNECSAPPLHTYKSGPLGYAIVTVDTESGEGEIAYRQWTNNHRAFVSGTALSGNDSGAQRLVLKPDGSAALPAGSANAKTAIEAKLLARRDNALKSFSSQPIIWIDPIISDKSEADAHSASYAPNEKDAENSRSATMFSVNQLITSPISTVIKAPPQFGLTCLATHLCWEACRCGRGLWLYLDGEELKPHKIDNVISNELSKLGAEEIEISCVVLDSWSVREKLAFKTLKKLCDKYPDLPIIVMQQTGDGRFYADDDFDSLDRDFRALHLWSLNRTDIRSVVSRYNEEHHIGDEDTVITRVVSDLDALNLHRTPLNCMTLLKVSEVHFDDNPVNRTEMIHRVLFLLFNVDDIPNYKTRPDLKDCEFVLGYFCETLLRKKSIVFTHEEMIREMRKGCEASKITLDVEVVFDVLCRNNILLHRGDLFCFKFTYWVYYFVAQRMHQSKDFANYMLSDCRYAQCPEVMEFYTGIDRRRDDALLVLLKDLQEVYQAMEKKCSLPEDLNPYAHARWQPTREQMEDLQEEVGKGVSQSNLPEPIKDQYADKSYNPLKPYDQSFRALLDEYSFGMLREVMRAAMRAIRNSDYSSAETKRQLLHQIMLCWELIEKIVLVIAPSLAEKGRVFFDGYGFYLLASREYETSDELFYAILQVIPRNIVNWHKDELFSQKMLPLLKEKIDSETNDLRRHNLILLLISKRPQGWKTYVQNYITSMDKSSWYLFDVFLSLRTEYKYGYASRPTLESIGYLLKMTAAKHGFGSKKPNRKLIGKISDEILPNRTMDDD